MPVDLLTPETADEWDARLVDLPARPSMFQTYEMAQTKLLAGWEPRFLQVGDVPVCVHVKNVPGLGQVWYAPKGPIVPDHEALLRLLPILVGAARKDGAFVIKIEPELAESEEALAALRAAGLRPSAPVQPNTSTIFMDVSGSEEDVLARIHQKRRYSIRRAERDGVVVERPGATQETCDIMYDLMTEVAEDQQFGMRSREYHSAFWQNFCRTGRGQLFVARHEGTPVAAAFATVIGDVSCYKDGASVRNRPAYGASIALQWDVIRWANEQGARHHDFCGTPHSSRMGDKEHPLHGIGEFKSGIPKDAQVTDYVGAWDVPVRPARLAAWDKAGYGIARRVLARRGAAFF